MNVKKTEEKPLDDSMSIYKAIFENSIDAIFITTPDGGIQAANNAACSMFGFTEDELIRTGRHGILDITDERIPLFLEEREHTGKIAGELRYKRKNGTIFPADFTSTVFYIEKEQKRTITIVRDITERKLLENNLVESEKNQRALIDAVDDSLFLIEPDGTILLANNKLAENFSKEMSEIIGSNTFTLVSSGLADQRRKMLEKAVSEHSPVAFTDIRSGKYIENRVFPVLDEKGNVSRLAIYGRDITLKTEAEELLICSNRLLEIINRASSKTELIESVVGFLRKRFGYEAVGIRLKDGDDFPYYETSGFSDEFVLKENLLCSYDKSGNPLCDSDGNPFLECMCGNVLCGRFDKSKSFFTENGSFWTNCTTELLASTTEADRMARTRNRCNGEGYESVGLFPVRGRNTIFGLIQINDKRKAVFSPLKVKMLEILGDNLGIAFDKFIIESELINSEDKFRMLINLSPAGIYMTDKDGKCTFVNEAWCKMAGMEAKEAYGDGWIQAIHPNDRQHIFNIWNNYVNTGEEWNWNYRFVDKSGKVTWVYGLSRPIVDSDGKTTGFLGTNTDISERRKVELALKESESRFKTMAENSLTGIYIVVDNKLKYVNKSLAEIFGYTVDELIGESPMKVIHPDDREMVAENMRRRISGEIDAMKYELRGLCRNGETKFILVLGEAVEIGGQRDIFGNILDITELKLAQQVLIESEERYRVLSEQSGVGVGLYSPEGVILYFNQRALGNLGGKAKDFIGKSLIDVFGRNEGTKYLKRVREEIRLEKNIIYEDYFESQSGKYWFSSTHSIVRNFKGKIIGVQVVSSDISERKRIESQLNQSANELRELTQYLVEVKESERTRIAHDLHDDLGQKLTALNMDISWLKSRIGVQSRNVENKLNQMVSLMNETIESVQKISHGLRPSILDDLGLLPAIEWQITDFHKNTGIGCRISYSPNEIQVDGRISLVVFRIVQEALTNIARHSGATNVKIRMKLIDNNLDLAIIDNGSGIDQEKIDSSRSFGLVGMKERLRAVDGDFSITGIKGEGTRIKVMIPVGK